MGYEHHRPDLNTRSDLLAEMASALAVGIILLLLALVLGAAICAVLTSTTSLLEWFLPFSL